MKLINLTFFSNKNSFLIFSFMILVLFLMYGNEIPDYDTKNYLDQYLSVMHGGIPALLTLTLPSGTAITKGIHPQLLTLLHCLFFNIFSESIKAVNFLGFCIFALNLFFYLKIKDYYLKNKNIFIDFLFLFNPMFIYFTFYPSHESIICLLLTISLFVFMSGQYNFFFIIAIFILSIKHTSLVLLLTIIINLFLVWIDSKNKKILITILVLLGITFVMFMGWNYVLSSFNIMNWHAEILDQNFENTSSYLIPLHRFFKFEVFDIFLFQNLHNAFVHNFQWLFVGIILFFFVLTLLRKIKITKSEFLYFRFLISFIFIYCLIIFTFPTWTVVRYSLPVISATLLIFIKILDFIKIKFLKNIIIFLCLSVSIVRLFYSVDFFTTQKKILYRGEMIYDFPILWRSADQIIYNLQALRISKNQNEFIKFSFKNNADYVLADCSTGYLNLRLKSLQEDLYSNFQGEYNVNLNKKLECIDLNNVDQIDSQRTFFKDKIIVTNEKLFHKFMLKYSYYFVFKKILLYNENINLKMVR
jgi:hypothetical protein